MRFPKIEDLLHAVVSQESALEVAPVQGLTYIMAGGEPAWSFKTEASYLHPPYEQHVVGLSEVLLYLANERCLQCLT